MINNHKLVLGVFLIIHFWNFLTNPSSIVSFWITVSIIIIFLYRQYLSKKFKNDNKEKDTNPPSIFIENKNEIHLSDNNRD